MSRRRKPQHRNPAKRATESEWPDMALPEFMASDEAYLAHLLSAAPEDLTEAQRQLLAELREHHPDLF